MKGRPRKPSPARARPSPKPKAKPPGKTRARRRNGRTNKRLPKPAELRRLALTAEGGVAPADLLRAVMTFSREVSAETKQRELYDLLYRTLRQLLPGRLIGIRIIDPTSLAVHEILADEKLDERAHDLPPVVLLGTGGPVGSPPPGARPRAGGAETTSAAEASNRAISFVDAPPLIFRNAAQGFAVALIAGGELTGEVHINYRTRTASAAEDRDLVLPLANHVAVVAHTRRVLRETAYLQTYLEQLIDQANALILATDPEGRVTVWNRAMHRVTGFSRGDVLGKPLLAWLTPLGAPDVGRVCKQVAASGAPATREVRLPTVGGAVLRAAFNVVAVRGPDGKPAAVLGIGQDVTALRQLQSQVIHAEKLATLGQIAAGVAHEINNPLTSVQVCATALVRKANLVSEAPPVFDDTDRDRLRKIEEGAERIRRFARELVSYARPSGGEVEEIAINELLEQALSFCEHVLDAAHARIERDYAGNLPLVQAVRDQILQVIINLVTNAADALDARGGVIRIRSWAAGEAIVGFAVSDAGAGIKDDDRSKIFDPFFTTKPAGRGTGLGLSVVRNIIYSHGGQISFQTRPGNGTTFLVTIPVTPLGHAEAKGAL